MEFDFQDQLNAVERTLSSLERAAARRTTAFYTGEAVEPS